MFSLLTVAESSTRIANRDVAQLRCVDYLLFARLLYRISLIANTCNKLELI